MKSIQVILKGGDNMTHQGRCLGIVEDPETAKKSACPGTEHLDLDGELRTGYVNYAFSRGLPVTVTCPRNIVYFETQAKTNPGTWEIVGAKAAPPAPTPPPDPPEPPPADPPAGKSEDPEAKGGKKGKAKTE